MDKLLPLKLIGNC